MTKRPNDSYVPPRTRTLSEREAALYKLSPAVRASRGIADQRPAPFQRPGEWVADMPLGKEFVPAVLKEMRVPAATSGQIQLLAELSERYEKIAAKLSEWSANATNDRWKNQRDSISEQPESTRLQSREALQAEARARRIGLGNQLGAVSRDAHAVIVTILGDAQTTIGKWAERREKIERDEADKFGVEFQPSAILLTGWQASWRLLEQLTDPVLQSSPQFLLRNLPIDLEAK